MVKELPNIIAITETRLAEDSHHNIRIPGYIFLGVNSKTSAGGVGIYISENINFTRRNDLDLALTEGVENFWIEIQRIKRKNVVIGCIYRHPSQNRETFHEAIETKLNLLTDENCVKYVSIKIYIVILYYIILYYIILYYIILYYIILYYIILYYIILYYIILYYIILYYIILYYIILYYIILYYKIELL